MRHVINCLMATLPVIHIEMEDENIQTTVAEVEKEIETVADGSNTMLYIILAVVFVALATTAITFLVLSKRRNNERTVASKSNAIQTQKVANERKEEQTVVIEGERKKFANAARVVVVDNNDRICPKVVLININAPQVIYRTYISEHITIGRKEGSDIMINSDSAVSSVHCKIFVVGTQFYLEDCDSTNGTKYNDQDVTSRIPIINGGIIEIGHNKYRLMIEN